MKKVRRHWWVIFLLLAVVVVLLSPLSSSHPDGLERVAQDNGFLGSAREAYYRLIPDYIFPGIADAGAATIVAGMLGTLLMFGLGYGVAWLLRRQARKAQQDRRRS